MRRLLAIPLLLVPLAAHAQTDVVDSGVFDESATTASTASDLGSIPVSSNLTSIPIVGNLPGIGSILGLGGNPVVCTNCETLSHSVLNDAATAASWVTQLARMTTQIQQEIAIFQQLNGKTATGAMATVLNQAAMFNQLGAMGNIPGQLGGTTSGLGAAYLSANRLALPVGSVIPLVHTTSTIFNNRAGSLASVQGMTAQMMTSTNTILTGLQQLQVLIDQQPSAQTMLGINSRLASYQGDINTQQYQLNQMKAFADAQQKVFDQQQHQAGFCADADWVNATQSLTGAGATVGAANCAAGAGGAVVAGGGVTLAGGALGGIIGGTAGGTAVDDGGFDTPADGGTTTAGTTTAGNTLPVPPVPPAATPAAPVATDVADTTDLAGIAGAGGSGTGTLATLQGQSLSAGDYNADTSSLSAARDPVYIENQTSFEQPVTGN